MKSTDYQDGYAAGYAAALRDRQSKAGATKSAKKAAAARENGRKPKRKIATLPNVYGPSVKAVKIKMDPNAFGVV